MGSERAVSIYSFDKPSKMELTYGEAVRKVIKIWELVRYTDGYRTSEGTGTGVYGWNLAWNPRYP